MKYLHVLYIFILLIAYSCSEDSINNVSDTTDPVFKKDTLEVINNPSDTITYNTVFIYNHNYVYNSYNNDFMTFSITKHTIHTEKKWKSDWYGNRTQVGYGSQIIFYATGSRITKDQYNKLHKSFIDIMIFIDIIHPDSTIYGEYNLDNKYSGSYKGSSQIATLHFYEDPAKKTQASGFYDFASQSIAQYDPKSLYMPTIINIKKSKDFNSFTLTVDKGFVWYTRGMFNADIRFKGKLNGL